MLGMAPNLSLTLLFRSAARSMGKIAQYAAAYSYDGADVPEKSVDNPPAIGALSPRTGFDAAASRNRPTVNEASSKPKPASAPRPKKST
jgi:hypothetical protein